MQLVHAYNTIAERNDASLFHYGFVQDLDPPAAGCTGHPLRQPLRSNHLHRGRLW